MRKPIKKDLHRQSRSGDRDKKAKTNSRRPKTAKEDEGSIGRVPVGMPLKPFE